MIRTDAPLDRVLSGRSLVWRLGAVLAGSAVLAASARAEIPMIPAPITLQTFALMVIAGLSGPRMTVGIVALYLAEAAIGLPVLAGGAGGPAALLGPTGGYLAGFLPAGAAAALLAGRGRSVPVLAAAFVVGHLMILAFGGAWLSLFVGPRAAWVGGVAPFLIGSAIKTAMAVAVVKLVDAAAARPR